ncbi:hypothetical protein [Oceanobacillus sp. FSL H7-0719]|uniref:hypothetical protein n=1 Tax=Oceanobacillus sp. FSL H7-0719 TaxID=2954507 RepID=UPI00324EFF22
MFKELSAKILLFEYNEITFIVAIIFFGLIYMMSKKLIIWGTNKGMDSFLSYVLAGLLFLNLFLLIFIMYEVTTIRGVLAYFLQIIGLFGVLLVIGTIMKSFIKKLISKKA